MENNCVFCKIIKGEIPAVKIWDDKNFIAILDKSPNTEGMTLVMPKKHFDSDATDMPDKEYRDLMIAVKEVAKLLEKKLNVKRVAIVMEGMGVNHAHIKLYPLYGLDKKFEVTWAKERRFFERYEGYISTHLGPEKSMEELRKIAERIMK